MLTVTLTINDDGTTQPMGQLFLNGLWLSGSLTLHGDPVSVSIALGVSIDSSACFKPRSAAFGFRRIRRDHLVSFRVTRSLPQGSIPG